MTFDPANAAVKFTAAVTVVLVAVFVTTTLDAAMLQLPFDNVALDPGVACPAKLEPDVSIK